MSVSKSVSAVTLTVSSGSPSTTVSQTFSDSATLASLQLGSNSIPVTNPSILNLYATPGLQCSNTLSLAYGGVSNVAIPAAVSNFVATPIVLSNFGPSFTYSYVSGGVGTFTLPQPSSNGSSPGAFSYSVVGSAGVVSVSGNVVTMIAAGSTTIRATQAAAGGYASVYIDASVTINPIAPTFSNSGVFTISSKTIEDAPFTPAYPTSNSSGAFTYTSSNTLFATVNSTTGLVTPVAAGTTTIRATQAAAGGYTSAYVEASFAVTLPLIMLDTNGVTIKYTNASIPSVPYFIQASPRGTLEWFAVVNDTSKSAITDYAKAPLSGYGRLYFTTSGNVVPFNNIVTTLMTDMSYMFRDTPWFNENIGSWDISNVTSMSNMFYRAERFNQNIGSWNTSNVVDMSYALVLTSAFNQPINSWNTSKVTNMSYMLGGMTVFNQPINSWNTANVIYMGAMFQNSSKFNQNIGSWNTSNVTNMSNMFDGTTKFNQNISGWNVVKVTPKPPSDFSTNSALSYVNNPFSLLALDANGITVKYKGAALTTVPLFINANLRGTGSEWFAVVNDSSKSMITDYAKAPLSGYGRLYFTTSGNVVPFNNIVTTLMTDMSYMFRDTPWFNENIGSWDISNVTSMSNMFYRAERFNQNIGSWNTSNVVDMSYALVLTSAFNQPINSWNTSKVTNMGSMLCGMTVFNQPINSWDTANVIYMGAMFQNSSNFNQNIGSWNTSNVTNMSNMFDGATKFNQPINYDSTTGSWNTSKVTNMSNMFYNASAFNGSINAWNTANVTTMAQMFNSATAFNQPLNSWNTANVTNMYAMFAGATVFNQNIGSWNTANVTSLQQMFQSATAFNQPLNSWNTAKVTNMFGVFSQAYSFNQPLNSWNTANVTGMNNMFQSATIFNQNISNWIVTKVSPKPPYDFRTGSALTTEYSPVWV